MSGKVDFLTNDYIILTTEDFVMNRSPLPSKYINSVARTILEPIKRGESCFTRWFPGHGKTILLSKIFSDKKILSKWLGAYYPRFLIVKVDGFVFSTLELSNFFIYIQQILNTKLNRLGKGKQDYLAGFVNDSPPFIVTVRKIMQVCNQAIEDGKEVVFVINEIDGFAEEELKKIFNALEYIVESNRQRIHTHINVNKQNIIQDTVRQFALIQNILSIPLPSKKECQNYINYYCKEWKIKLSEEKVNSIFKVCGNDLGLIKEAIRLYERKKNNEINLLNEQTLLLKAKVEYELFGKYEKEVVESMVKTGTITPQGRETAEKLIEMNFWNKQYQVPQLIEQIIIRGQSIRDLNFDKEEKILKFGEVDLTRRLSASEYEILLLLYKKQGKLVSRDEIGEALWGENMLDKYSDWAIDKAISRLRSKISSLGIPYQILTKKKRGFYLEI